MTSIFEGHPPKKKQGLNSIQNKGPHLGSRYRYITPRFAWFSRFKRQEQRSRKGEASDLGSGGGSFKHVETPQETNIAGWNIPIEIHVQSGSMLL